MKYTLFLFTSAKISGPYMKRVQNTLIFLRRNHL
nr:MAG TPA: hypothetical protein [Caudoviricetes sp.]